MLIFKSKIRDSSKESRILELATIDLAEAHFTAAGGDKDLFPAAGIMGIYRDYFLGAIDWVEKWTPAYNAGNAANADGHIGIRWEVTCYADVEITTGVFERKYHQFSIFAADGTYQLPDSDDMSPTGIAKMNTAFGVKVTHPDYPDYPLTVESAKLVGAKLYGNEI